MMSLTVHKDKGNVITCMPSHDVAVLRCLICWLLCIVTVWVLNFHAALKGFLLVIENNHPLIDKSSSFESFNYV